MSASSRRSGPAVGLETVVLWTLLGAVGIVVGSVWAATQLAAYLTGTTTPPGNPFELAVAVVTGRLSWSPAASVALAAIAAGLAGLGLLGEVIRRRLRARPEVDRAARRLATGAALGALTGKAATATAARLGAVDAGPGLPIGRTIAGNQMLFSSWEDVSVDIWGPRTGKTTSRAIPAIMAAPGAVVVTSNKRDIVDATRGPREAVGDVWVFDPQQIIGEPAGWWWNPLSYVRDEVHARILADLFAAGSRDLQATTDAFFDSAGRDLLAGLLLAAAVADLPIVRVYEWLCRPGDDEPAELLVEAGLPLTAGAVSAAVLAPDRQRAGVYATAQQAVSFLTNREALPWITPQPDDGRPRPELVPAELVAGPHTLYAVSKEGRGTLGPLVAGLTVAVTEAAEARAKVSPGGRLPVPLVAVLDEAANVCRWPDLPDLYSHYGSRGIVIMTILQSWSQGVQVWGVHGMRKLWSAANIRVYGGGVAEVEFLGELAQLTGEFDRLERSRTDAKGGSSSTHSVRSERVLEVADLAALPRGRALLIPSGGKPVLIGTQPWMDGPHAPAITASLLRHDPTGRPRAYAETVRREVR